MLGSGSNCFDAADAQGVGSVHAMWPPKIGIHPSVCQAGILRQRRVWPLPGWTGNRPLRTHGAPGLAVCSFLDRAKCARGLGGATGLGGNPFMPSRGPP
jgi:hypothetical protein